MIYFLNFSAKSNSHIVDK